MHVHHKSRSYDVWFLTYKVQRTKFFCHFRQFFGIWPFWQSKKSKFWKIKTMPGDIIILHLCTTNDDHMMYDFWHIKCNRQSFIFWAIFCIFTSLTIQKIKNLKKWKKLLDILFCMMIYDVWFLKYGAWRTAFSLILDHFLPFHLPPPPLNNPKKQNF